MNTNVYCEDLIVLYNACRGSVFLWCLLMLVALAWIIVMFIKKKIGQTGNEEVYKQNKQNKDQGTLDQIKNPSDGEKNYNQYQKSEEVKSENKQDDFKNSTSLEGSSAPQPVQNSAQPQSDSKTGLEKALIGFQEYLFNYIPFFVINILNIVCFRSWAFNLVVWFLIMIPIAIINLLGLFLKIENRFIQCFLKSIWIFVGVCWYINFYATRAACWNNFTTTTP